MYNLQYTIFNLAEYLTFLCRVDRAVTIDRLENVTHTISRILDGYDIRLRPNFGGKYAYASFVYIYLKFFKG